MSEAHQQPPDVHPWRVQPSGDQQAQAPVAAQISNKWFRRTFTSTDRTAELLRPELETGNLTARDFEAAVRFLPNPIFHNLPIVFSVGSGCLATLYGVYRRRWPVAKLSLYTLGSAFIGHDIGSTITGIRIFRFQRGLEEPRGFGIAIRNIRERSQAEQQLSKGTTIPERISQSQEGLSSPREENPAQWAWPDQDKEHKSFRPPDLQPQQQDKSTSGLRPSASNHTRWDEIRAANQTNQAQPSVWAKLRENEARSAYNTDTSRQRSERDGHRRENRVDQDRAQAQAEFDMLLENERRNASQ